MPADDHFKLLFSSGFLPSGQSFLWKPALLWLHGLSDGFIVLAYYAISFQLLYLVLRRRSSQFRMIYWLLCAFVFAAGTMHLMDVWTLWEPDYWLSGSVKALTAILSILTATVLVTVIPTTLTMRTQGEVDAMNRELALARDAALELARIKDLAAQTAFGEARDAAQAASAAARELALMRELAQSRDATISAAAELEHARSEARDLAGTHDADATAAELARVLAEARALAAAHEAAVKTAAELAEARDAALRSDRLKSEFLANMSHEIRTPLNGIVGMSELLRDSKLSNDQREFADLIGSSADSLLTIVNDILDFSKIAAGKLVFEEIDFDVTHTIEAVVNLLSERASKKNLELILSIDPELPTYVRGDPIRLRQVITNLLGNAIKFTDHGEVVVSVSLMNKTDRDVILQIKLADTGIGISPDARLQLFQPFHQADGSTTRKYGGTGLGLAISAQLVELMGGRIEVESELGKGSTFLFSARFGHPASVAMSVEPKSLFGLRVLVVDDNKTNRQIVERQIANWGISSASAAGGSQALGMLRERAVSAPYDVAVLDLAMPGMDGLMLAQLIKTDPAIANTRLLMMSSIGGRADAGANTSLIEKWLTKPVKQSQLYNSLADLMTTAVTMLEVRPRAIEPEHPAEEESPTDDPILAIRQRTRVLVAEDNLINQSVAKHQLRKIGYLFDVVGSGTEALEAMAATPYPLILMDWMMPDMDGFAATKELRRREGESGQHTIVVAMTANVLEGDRAKCLAAGMDDYISKPVQLVELTAILDRWLIPREQPAPAEAGEAAPAPLTGSSGGIFRKSGGPDVLAEIDVETQPQGSLNK